LCLESTWPRWHYLSPRLPSTQARDIVLLFFKWSNKRQKFKNRNFVKFEITALEINFPVCISELGGFQRLFWRKKCCLILKRIFWNFLLRTITTNIFADKNHVLVFQYRNWFNSGSSYTERKGMGSSVIYSTTCSYLGSNKYFTEFSVILAFEPKSQHVYYGISNPLSTVYDLYCCKVYLLILVTSPTLRTIFMAGCEHNGYRHCAG
jgi:hypothetical protein